MNESDLIDAFVTHLGIQEGYPRLRVERRPDEENRNSPDIDAIAGPFRIEHTSIDTLANQRRDADWFSQAVDGIERELKGTLPFRLCIWLEYDAVRKGQDWAAIRSALKKWVVNEAPYLDDGRSIVGNIPNIPFRLHILKASERPHIFGFARFEPQDDTLQSRVKEIFDRKAAKLAKYQAPEAITVLLVESDDIALMNDGKMLEAVRGAFPDGPPQGVDQVWYAETTISDQPRFLEFTPEL